MYARAVTYITAEARQELLHYVAEAIDEIGKAIGALGEAYELLDERTADVLEEQLFRPIQTAYGRARRTHSAFAARYGLVDRQFTPAAAPASANVHDLLATAVDAAAEADAIIAQLQDSMRPVEVGDPELRAGLAEVRTLLGDVPARARALERVVGR